MHCIGVTLFSCEGTTGTTHKFHHEAGAIWNHITLAETGAARGPGQWIHRRLRKVHSRGVSRNSWRQQKSVHHS